MAIPISYNLRNIRERWKVTLLAIGGIGLVVAVFITLLSMLTGFRTALRSTGTHQNAIITQRGSLSELTSWFSREHANKIQVDPRIARASDGQPLVSCEVLVLTNLPKRTDGQPTNVNVRGVTPRAYEVRQGVNVIQGRMYRPALYEIIVGKPISERIQGLELGSKVKIMRRDFEVVGLFEAQGGSFESEIWGDYTVMEPLFGRGGGCESMTARLADPTALSQFDKDLQADPEMRVQAKSERKYYEDQAGPVAAALIALAAFVAIVMGIGAVFGAMNTMYGIVAHRTREVGTLRALGFSRFSILFSFVVESVFLALLGGLLGCLLALPMNGFTAGTGQTSSFSELAFAFRVTPQLMVIGLIFAAVMGLAGGLLPALRAARLPITTALREA